MTSQRDDLLSNAFLEAAVPDEGVGVVIDEIPSEPFAQERLGECHSRRVGDALAQGPVVTSIPQVGSNSGWPSQWDRVRGSA